MAVGQRPVFSCNAAYFMKYLEKTFVLHYVSMNIPVNKNEATVNLTTS